MNNLERTEAIQIVCEEELSRLTIDERKEQLWTMMREDWASLPDWSTIPSEVRNEFEEPHDLDDPMATRYDPILMLWLKYRYRAARNEYLLDRLQKYGFSFNEVAGEPIALLPCSCCGYRTLSSYEMYEICPVCWWEDDGRGDQDASLIDGGPHYGLSRTRARFNFLKYGISDPSRDDLRNHQEPTEKYERGRIFELHSNGYGVYEQARGWYASLDEEHH